MSHEEIKKRLERVAALEKKLLDATKGESHELLLAALLTAFINVAEAYPCCTRVAAVKAIMATERLHSTANANDAETETRPQGAPLH